MELDQPQDSSELSFHRYWKQTWVLPQGRNLQLWNYFSLAASYFSYSWVVWNEHILAGDSELVLAGCHVLRMGAQWLCLPWGFCLLPAAAALLSSGVDQPQQGLEQAEVVWGVFWFYFKMLNVHRWQCLVSLRLILLLSRTETNVPSWNGQLQKTGCPQAYTSEYNVGSEQHHPCFVCMCPYRKHIEKELVKISHGNRHCALPSWFMGIQHCSHLWFVVSVVVHAALAWAQQ